MSENRSLQSAISSHSEDETFRKLSQRPYEEANEAWVHEFKNGYSDAALSAALEKIGWTKDEYYRAYTEYNRR